MLNIKNHHGNDYNQSSDVLFYGTAPAGWKPGGVITEKISVAFFDIGISMVALGRHERDIPLKKIVGIIAAASVYRFDQ